MNRPLTIAELARAVEPQALAQQAGSRTFNGPQMIYKPRPQLITAATGVVGGTWTGRVRMPVPDSRCRVKLSVIFYPRQGGAIPVALKESGSIWVAGYEEDTDGVSGSGGMTEPVQDVEGTSDAPTQFPVSAGLAGYSREFVTAADWIEAVITLGGAATILGQWTLQTRIQPDAGALFSWAEWDQIRGNFDPKVYGTGQV